MIPRRKNVNQPGLIEFLGGVHFLPFDKFCSWLPKVTSLNSFNKNDVIMTQSNYSNDGQLLVSDHRPVFGDFSLKVTLHFFQKKNSNLQSLASISIRCKIDVEIVDQIVRAKVSYFFYSLEKMETAQIWFLHRNPRKEMYKIDFMKFISDEINDLWRHPRMRDRFSDLMTS